MLLSLVTVVLGTGLQFAAAQSDKVVQAGWQGLDAKWPGPIEFSSSTLTQRAQGRRSAVLAGHDAAGPIQAIVVERDGFLAATLLDGSGIRWGARGTTGQPLRFELLPPEALRDCAGGVDAPPEIRDSAFAQPNAQGGVADACTDAPTIDVLILTTPLARQQAGGAGPLAALVDLAETSANAAYANSAISPRIRVIYETEVAYTEVSFGADLSSLANGSDGILDEMHQLRAAAGADLVAMIRSTGEYCGIAYLLPSDSPSNSGIGFSVTAWSCLSTQTLAHELGHNMGCCHAPNDGGGCTTGGVFPESVGHRFNGSSGTEYRTVMAYAPGSRIDHFSNPLVNFNNTPTGIAPTASDPGRNNAATIATTNASIRGFQCAVPPGAFGDCDGDGRVDILQLAEGSASDVDGNGVLDTCDLASGGLCANPSRFLSLAGLVSALPSAAIVADNYYGYAVDTDGRTAVVGAYGDDVGADFAGSATVFSLAGDIPQRVAVLRHVNPGAIDLFGRAVAIDGDFIAIGSESRDVAGLNAAGDVTIYAKSPTGAPWQLVATLTAPTPSIGGRFGAALALRGTTLVVGSPESFSNTGVAQYGRCYVYQRVGAVWTLAKTLTQSDQTSQGSFGYAVALFGNVICIGAPFVVEAGRTVGAVYVSERVGSSWQSAVRLTGLPATTGNAGISVAVDGLRIAVGASGSGASSESSIGAVYLFQKQGNSWQLNDTLQPPSFNLMQKFGTRVAIDGDGLFVGSWRVSTSSGTHEYFQHSDTGWNRVGPVRSGFAVAMRGETAAVGAFRDLRSAIPCGDARLEQRFTDADLDNKIDRCELRYGDLNLDAVVDGLDLAILLAGWGSDARVPDINQDSSVNGLDLTILLANWGAH